jgi:hypothetical protein
MAVIDRRGSRTVIIQHSALSYGRHQPLPLLNIFDANFAATVDTATSVCHWLRLMPSTISETAFSRRLPEIRHGFDACAVPGESSGYRTGAAVRLRANSSLYGCTSGAERYLASPFLLPFLQPDYYHNLQAGKRRGNVTRLHSL